MNSFSPRHFVRTLFVLATGMWIAGWLTACTIDLTDRSTPTPAPLPTLTPTAAAITAATNAAPIPTAGPRAITVAVGNELPEELARPLFTSLLGMMQVEVDGVGRPLVVLDQQAVADVRLQMVGRGAATHPIAERYYAVVVPFATVQDDMSLDTIRAYWRGEKPLLATAAALRDLAPLLGGGIATIVAPPEMAVRLAGESEAVGIIGFDQLEPTLKVLTVDGVDLLDNRLDPTTYALAVAVEVEGTEAGPVASALRGALQPVTNRDPQRLTTLIMTGVTAMSRGTAARMEVKGDTYPAEIISATLRAADITHVSNEIPFINGCVVRNVQDNLVLCSDYPYWEALAAIGTDIVGLSGNHVNDFGRSGARESLQFYRDRNIPIYGSGLNIDEACAPLRWEHNGNTFAFIAALAFWPRSAFATADEPGACYYYENYDAIIAGIRQLSQEVDIVSVELQYLETYNPFPTPEQVQEFRDLRAAGADIVTGVQSHVPQAWEPYGVGDAGGPGIIVYGLGNLFFDQMWSWETRTELYARHAIYEGKLISSQVLTGILEDYAQPRWATPEERAGILTTIFNGAPARP